MRERAVQQKSPWRGIQESCVDPFNSGKERKVKEAAPPIVRTILCNKTTLMSHTECKISEIGGGKWRYTSIDSNSTSSDLEEQSTETTTRNLQGIYRQQGIYRGQ